MGWDGMHIFELHVKDYIEERPFYRIFVAQFRLSLYVPSTNNF